jgi:O-antigen ligase
MKVNVTWQDLPLNLGNARQVSAIATAFTLPLSTTGQNITVAIFMVLALITLDVARFRATLRSAAGYLPVALFALILIGVLWSMQPYGLAIRSVSPYAKLLLIPLVIATSFTPRQTLQIGCGFLAGCVVVLVISWVSLLWPSGPWYWFKSPGVPVKDNAVQSGCFALCAFGLAIGTVRTWLQGDRRAIAMRFLAILFFANIFLIYLSKTGMIMAGSLLALLILHTWNWRLALAIAAPAALIVAIALWLSGPAQLRLAEMSIDMHASDRTGETLSTAARLDFWSKALVFVKEAPLLGHGTGSIKPLYQSMEATRPSPLGEARPDPHNQFLHVTPQVGLLGGVILLAMWAAHFRMFLHRDVVSIMGQAVVLQNVVGSLFNSHLATVTQGMLYCLAVGVLGAAVQDRLAGPAESFAQYLAARRPAEKIFARLSRGS